MKKYVFKPYNSLFPLLFIKEKERISQSLFQQACIKHVGSTAIPGLGGKGIIDIAIAVEKSMLSQAKLALETLGYEFRSSFSTEERFYFVAYLPDCEEGLRRYHLHLTHPQSKPWQDLIGFKNYLLCHPKKVKEYAALKKRAALEAKEDGKIYQKIKEPIFQKYYTFLLKQSKMLE